MPCLIKEILSWEVDVHAFNPRTERQRWAYLCELEATLLYKMSLRIASTIIQRNTILKEKNRREKNYWGQFDWNEVKMEIFILRDWILQGHIRQDLLSTVISMTYYLYKTQKEHLFGFTNFNVSLKVHILEISSPLQWWEQLSNKMKLRPWGLSSDEWTDVFIPGLGQLLFKWITLKKYCFM